MNGCQTILFDLDGTLTDPMEGITRCVQYALRSFGIEVADRTELEPFIGPPLKESFMEFYGFTEAQAGVAVEKYRERFQDTGIYENIPYCGMKELLHGLKKQGKTLAVASSKPEVYVMRILEHFELAEFFDVVTGSEMDGRRTGKEEVIEETITRLETLGITERGQMVMVGDRKFDVAGAHASGMRAIGAAYGYAAEGELEQAGAEVIVHTVEELGRELLGEML
ncbi:MAG: HAD hydrolase-like protein [Clostridiales bacterium]|nr:HAD hydrolase-like protein [Clostridiales bacterium]